MSQSVPHSIDLTSWKNGTCSDVHLHLGAHTDGSGVRFAVWAPHAARVTVVGDFNGWDRSAHPLTLESDSGIWSGHVPAAGAGDRYMFAVFPSDGSDAVLKADPVAFRSEPPPGTASVVEKREPFPWSDAEWMEQRPARQAPDRPIAIYEVHLGSWQREGDRPVNYREVADPLLDHVQEMGFTHIELLPIAEHPYGASWGYQVTGYFAPTARYGSPDELRAFIDRCHRRGVGVILDLVPGHFPRDSHGLVQFDGTPLFEHPDPRRSEHADWGTVNVDFEKGEVRSFMVSNACYWCREFHVDGLRIDAVASMLYLDYSRSEGEWLPNRHGGRENLGSVAFLREMNRQVERAFGEGVMTVAEESTDWPKVTAPVEEGGLGFDYKWNMGWMNDTLRYFSLPPEKRTENSHSVTFPLTWAFDERFILPFSHDEVVHMKQSLWGKMPGNDADKMQHLRTLFLFWIGSPGKKLLFMGGEWGQRTEWAEGGSLDWDLLAVAAHRDLKSYMESLLKFYRSERGLHFEGAKWNNFEWGDGDGASAGVVDFRRNDPSSGRRLRFIFNFSPQTVHSYRLSIDPGSTPDPVFQTELQPTAFSIRPGFADLPPRFGIVLEEPPEQPGEDLPQ